MRLTTLLFLVCCAVPAAIAADPVPAKGRFLVATEQVRGSDFEESVILLLQYDERGAAGLIVNKPTPAEPQDAMPDLDGLARYEGKLYYGGPVSLNSIQALAKTGTAPDPSTHVTDDIYIVPINDELFEAPSDSSTVRFFIGYSGWGPGQLDGELLRGSWHVVPGSGDQVFSREPESLWQQLRPPEILRASSDRVSTARASQPLSE